MVKTVVICGGHAQFQNKAEEFIKNSNEEIKIETFEIDIEINDLPKSDHLIIYREREIDLHSLLKRLDSNKNIILVGDIQREDKTLAHDFGIDEFIYIPECVGNQLDPYIREIEKSIDPNGGVIGF